MQPGWILLYKVGMFLIGWDGNYWVILSYIDKWIVVNIPFRYYFDKTIVKIWRIYRILIETIHMLLEFLTIAVSICYTLCKECEVFDPNPWQSSNRYVILKERVVSLI
jgi:hypothetical protein